MTLQPHHPLHSWTTARVGIGRSGGSLPTSELLRFRRDHALARDAVHTPFELSRLATSLQFLGQPILQAPSLATDRSIYLQRPDLGRTLHPDARRKLESIRADYDLAIILGDGLSATACHQHGPSTLQSLLPRLTGWSLAPLILAPFSRVALQDEIGHTLGARAALILLGERPGLGSPDSLSAYLVHHPKPGNTDAQRNCVSNIRPAGLTPYAAAHRIAWLLTESRRLGFSGVDLKDASDQESLPDLGSSKPGNSSISVQSIRSDF